MLFDPPHNLHSASFYSLLLPWLSFCPATSLFPSSGGRHCQVSFWDYVYGLSGLVSAHPLVIQHCSHINETLQLPQDCLHVPSLCLLGQLIYLIELVSTLHVCVLTCFNLNLVMLTHFQSETFLHSSWAPDEKFY